MEKYLNNPVVGPRDIPDIPPNLIDVTSVFNPGAIAFKDKILLMLRVQNRARETSFVMAESDRGMKFTVDSKPIMWQGLDAVKQRIYHIYDPRITHLDGRYYVMFAMDLEDGCHLGLGVTDDFKSFEFLGVVSEEDNRNGVLFPEKINGKYLRLDRPNKLQWEGGPCTGNAIFVAESEDLLHWTHTARLFEGSPHYWDEFIGPGTPPIKTREGWLCIYHGIAMHYQPIYQAGVFLLDLDDPTKLIARGRYNVLEPRELYETTGQVPNVCFPTGAIVAEQDADGFALPQSQVKIYYGAADTSVALATTTVQTLLEACHAQ